MRVFFSKEIYVKKKEILNYIRSYQDCTFNEMHSDGAIVK